MTLTYYVGGKLVGLTADFPPSLNHPEFTTFINSETFEEFILVSGVWEIIGVRPIDALFSDDFTTDKWDYTSAGSSFTYNLAQLRMDFSISASDSFFAFVDVGVTFGDADYFYDYTIAIISIGGAGNTAGMNTVVY